MDNRLTSADLIRYSRQISLPEVGEEGQAKLLQARVLVVGAGGLGSPVLYYLAAAGVGTLGIADADKVSLSNLQRQILYTVNDVGREKVDAASERLLQLNPDINVNKHLLQVSADNLTSLLSGYDIVVGAVDNPTTRYLLNDGCHLLKKPLVEAGVSGFEGLLMTIIPGQTPCYRCLFPVAPSEEIASQFNPGIMGMVAGTIGALQALEVIKLILGIGSPSSGRLLAFRGLQLRFEEILLERSQHCPLCGINLQITSL